MISRSKKFIFIHIPKTAGNSIAFALKRFSEDTFYWSDGTIGEIRSKYNTKKHSTLLRYRKYVRGISRYTTFSVIRNPFDRAISLYFYGLKYWHKSDKHLDKEIDIEVLKKILDTQLGRTQFRYLQAGGFLKVDYLLRFESLNEDFKSICKVLKLDTELPIRLPVTNVGSHKPYQYYYEECDYGYEAFKIVRDKYVKDLDVFGYSYK